ncbi:hypothetical protein V6N13_048832 [Hibiscus sabdariffa]
MKTIHQRFEVLSGISNACPNVSQIVAFVSRPRENNKVAHVVAAIGKKFHSNVYWVEEAMPFADADRKNLGLS